MSPLSPTLAKSSPSSNPTALENPPFSTSSPHALPHPKASSLIPPLSTLLPSASSLPTFHNTMLPSLLIVLETFTFAACLLLPNPSSSSSSNHISSLVSSLLSNLRLSHLTHTHLAYGLSRGERRCVSIGLSLLHDPTVLPLDEPTSGLNSASAFNIMHALRTIAASCRRTVILSIHEPNFKILSTIDNILLLSKGTVVHHGTLSSLHAFLHSNGFTAPLQLNTLKYAMEILNQLHQKSTINTLYLDSSSSPSVSLRSQVFPHQSLSVGRYQNFFFHI